jgi:hypothetical protein
MIIITPENDITEKLLLSHFDLIFATIVVTNKYSQLLIITIKFNIITEEDEHETLYNVY